MTDQTQIHSPLSVADKVKVGIFFAITPIFAVCDAAMVLMWIFNFLYFIPMEKTKIGLFSMGYFQKGTLSSFFLTSF